jgi:GNAT superfamily N-acetyltransferase
MANDCKIRPYSPGDLIPAVALWYRAWHESHPGEPHAFAIEEWRTRWQQGIEPYASVHVAEVDGVLSGYLAVLAAEPWNSHVIVTPEYRRRGIGRRLIEAAKTASTMGLIFDVFAADTASRNFYAGCAFLPGETVSHPRTGQAMIRYVWMGGA